MIDFSASVKNDAFRRPGGRCECMREHADLPAPHHGHRSQRSFTKRGNWHALYKIPLDAGGGNSLGNCEIVCEKCYELAGSKGK